MKLLVLKTASEPDQKKYTGTAPIRTQLKKKTRQITLKRAEHHQSKSSKKYTHAATTCTPERIISRLRQIAP
jgi:hypothetical protein